MVNLRPAPDPRFSDFRTIRSPRVFKAYRYLQPEFADDFRRGRIYIGTMESFSALEDAQADPLDSGAQLNIDAHIKDPSDPRLATLAQVGFNLTRGYDVHFTNCSVHYAATGHALCMSLVPDNPAFLKEGKTAVFEIADTEKFGILLTQAGGGCLSFRMSGGPVYYENRISSLNQGLIHADPFKKDPKFAHEKEIRLFWDTADAVSPVIVSAPLAAALIKQVR